MAFQIVGGSSQSRRIVTQSAKGCIATVAQRIANLAGRVVMVKAQSRRGSLPAIALPHYTPIMRSANRATASENGVVLVKR